MHIEGGIVYSSLLQIEGRLMHGGAQGSVHIEGRKEHGAGCILKVV